MPPATLSWATRASTTRIDEGRAQGALLQQVLALTQARSALHTEAAEAGRPAADPPQSTTGHVHLVADADPDIGEQLLALAKALAVAPLLDSDDHGDLRRRMTWVQPGGRRTTR